MIVADVEVAVARLTASGYEVVDVDLTRPVWREAFVRPRSGCGTLLQLADTTKRWDVPAGPDTTLDDVLAGRVVLTDDEEPVARDR